MLSQHTSLYLVGAAASGVVTTAMLGHAEVTVRETETHDSPLFIFELLNWIFSTNVVFL